MFEQGCFDLDQRNTNKLVYLGSGQRKVLAVAILFAATVLFSQVAFAQSSNGETKRIENAVVDFVMNGTPLYESLPTRILETPSGKTIPVVRLQSSNGTWTAASIAISKLVDDLNATQTLRLARVKRQIHEEQGRKPAQSWITSIKFAEASLGRILTDDEFLSASTPKEQFSLVIAGEQDVSASLFLMAKLRSANNAAVGEDKFAAATTYGELWAHRAKLGRSQRADLSVKYVTLLATLERKKQARAILAEINREELSVSQLVVLSGVELAVTPNSIVRPKQSSATKVSAEPRAKSVVKTIETTKPSYAAGTTVRVLTGVSTPTVVDAAKSVNARETDVRFEAYFTGQAKVGNLAGGDVSVGARGDIFQYLKQSHLSYSRLTTFLEWSKADRDLPLDFRVALNGNFDHDTGTVSSIGTSISVATSKRLAQDRFVGVTATIGATENTKSTTSDQISFSVEPWHRWADIAGSDWDLRLTGMLHSVFANHSGNSFVAAGAKIRASRDLNEDAHFFADVGFERLSYLGTDTIETTIIGLDTVVSGNAGVTFNISDSTTIDASVSARRQNSNIARRDYMSANAAINIRGRF